MNWNVHYDFFPNGYINSPPPQQVIDKDIVSPFHPTDKPVSSNELYSPISHNHDINSPPSIASH